MDYHESLATFLDPFMWPFRSYYQHLLSERHASKSNNCIQYVCKVSIVPNCVQTKGTQHPWTMKIVTVRNANDCCII